MKARKHMVWSTRRKLARAAASLLTASMLMQSMPLMAEEAVFAGEDLFSAETVEEVSVQDAAAALAEEDAYAPEAEAAEAAADLFAEAPADAPEEDLLISEDEQTDDQGGEDLVIEGEEQTEAPEEAEEGLTAEEILADDDALLAELFGEEEAEELPETEEFFTSSEEFEPDDPVVIRMTSNESNNAQYDGKVLMSHAGAGQNFPGSYGGELPERAANIYNALVDYYTNGGTGTLNLGNDVVGEISFTATIEEKEKDGAIIRVPAECEELKSLRSDIQSALDAFFYDHVEVFWIHGGTYKWEYNAAVLKDDPTKAVWNIENGVTYTPKQVYSDASDYAGTFTQMLQSVAGQISANSDFNDDGISTSAEIVRSIHDYLCDTLTYDDAGYSAFLAAGDSATDYRIFSAGAAFVPEWGGKAVCEGYSKAFKVLCDYFAIPAILVKGKINSGSLHMWNAVKLGDTWYIVDVTWDDEEDDFNYFLSEDFADREKLFNFSSSDPDKAISMSFWYPIFSSDRYDYCQDGGHEFDITKSGFHVCRICLKWKLEEAEILGLTDQIYNGSAIEPSFSVKHNKLTLKKNEDYTVAFNNNTEAGTAQIIITGGEYYLGEITKEFTILPRDINTTGFVFDLPEEVIWTGEAQTPVLSVLSDNGILLTEGSDYTVTYENNTDCGDALVTLEGIGNYTGTKTLTFAITKGNMQNMSFDELSSAVYTGSAHEPQVVVRDGEGNHLTAGTDYTVSYSSNINAGTAQVKVTGTGDYRGEKTLSFTIEKADVSTAEIEVDGPVEYNGAKQEPGLTVTVDGRTLVKDTDFEVVYPTNKNIDIGYGEYTVFGMGNYTGEKTGHFAIEAGNIAALSFEASSEEAWTGEEIRPAVTITDAAGNQLTDGYVVDYADNIEPGIGKITITGVGNYTRTKTLTFKIIRDIADLTVSQPATQTYTGSAIKPAVKVTTEDGTELVAGTDYTVTYDKTTNVNVGTATGIVTGKGYYTGTKEVTFQIGARSVSGMTIAAIPNKTYTGSAQKPAPKVTWGSKTLVSGTDYTVAYKNNTNAGTATVTVTGKGNYKGTLSATFKINAKKITPAVTLSATAFTFNGKVRKPTVTVKDGTKTLTTDDYTVTYASGRKNVGVYKVTVKLKGNYSGTKTVTFKINPKGTTVKTLTAASKAITVKWTKQATKMASSVITGYQIQLATNSTFTANKKLVTVAGFKKVSRKVTGLMGAKKYYVRIRTYKTISGTKYYSPWSKAKTVKTLK